MTCILGTKNFIAADRRVCDNGKSSSMVKVTKNKNLIIGIAGYSAVTLEIRQALRKGLKQPEDVIEFINDGFTLALILTQDKMLYRVQDGNLWPQSKFDMIGTGASIMLGFIGRDSKKITHDVVRKAMKFIGKHRIDCGGGCDIRYFK